jgi:protein-disulfide isomerase
MIMTTEAKVIIGTILTTVIVLVGGAVWMTWGQPPAPKDQVDTKETLNEKAHKIGNPSAKVKIAEYGDFQCPSCAAAEPILQQVLKDYGDKVYFEYIHFPLKMHTWAQNAAESAEAAGAQGKFKEYHDLLYAKQNEWSPSKDAPKLFSKYAGDLKLDQQKFDDDIKNHTYRQVVLDQLKQGEKLGVAATPTFFINGKRYEGGLDLEAWKQAIDPLLK